MEGRNLFLGEEITADSVKYIIEKLLEFNEEDGIGYSEYKDYEPATVNLHINTNGGSVYDGLALMSMMDLTIAPINTIAVGSVMSMGLPIYLMGDTRYATKYSTFMWHEISSSGLGGKLSSINDMSCEMDRLENICRELILDKTDITEEYLDEIKNSRYDCYIDSEQAIELGIAEELL